MITPNYYLVDSNIFVVQAYAEFLHNENWKFIPGNIMDDELITKYSIDAFVSPANSLGYMDGGVDESYLYYFGNGIGKRVMLFIENFYGGKLPVGEAMIVPTRHAKVSNLIVTPTMLRPGPVNSKRDIFNAAYALFSTINSYNYSPGAELNGYLKNIAMTGLGTGIGMLEPEVSAIQVAKAYDLVYNCR